MHKSTAFRKPVLFPLSGEEDMYKGVQVKLALNSGSTLSVATDLLWFEFQRKPYTVLLLTSWCSYNVPKYPLKRSHGDTRARMERDWQAKADCKSVPLGLARIQLQTAYSALFLGLSWS
jgi:hypothetical protein